MASLSAGHTVLTPNSELAAALCDAVDRHHRAAGREIWPTPRVRDFGSWLRERHAERALGDAAAPRVLGELEEREVWRAVVLLDDRSGEFLDPAAAAAGARRASRAMREYGISRAALQAFGSEESRIFLRWLQRFDARCAELGCVSGDALQLRYEPATEPLAWIESPAWRPLARRWLQRHGAPLLPAAVAGAQVGERICRVPSPDDELSVAAGWACDQLSSNAQFRAWIYIPDLPPRRALVADAFDAALAPQRFGAAAAEGAAAYAIAGGSPLAHYAPVRAALDALELSTGPVPFARFSAALRAAELQTSAAQASAAALLDLELRRHAPDELPLVEWLDLANRLAAAGRLGEVGALVRLQQMRGVLDSVRGRQPLSRWVRVWIEAFERGPWAASHRWGSAEYQSAERFRELLSALASADHVWGARSRSAADRLLRTAANDTAFQPQTGIAPIWISGQAMDPWLIYDGIWIAGFSEQAWPPPLDPLPLLPVRLQREYGVIAADAPMQLAMARDLMARWRCRAPINIFSLAPPGEAQIPCFSPLLGAQTPPLEAAQAPPRPHWQFALQRAPQLQRLDDDRAPPFAEPERTRGVSTLRAQSLCAFRGFAETRLQSLRIDAPQPGFNAAERGRIVHEALERIWGRLGGSAGLQRLTADDQSDLIASCAAAAIAAVCAARDPGARWRRREERRLHALLAEWLAIERERAAFEVERLERGDLAPRHAGVEFHCRIDRIDRLADGSRVLLDYKTGADEIDWRGDRPANPQLLVYALAQRERLVAVAYGRVSVGGCRFIPESERAGVFAPGQQRSKLEGEDSLARLLEVWEGRVERLAAAFAAGSAEVAPLPAACQYCHLQALCRIGAGHDP